MLSSPPAVPFSLAQLQLAAGNLLQVNPDPVPAYRLLREVLRLPGEDKELRRAKKAAEQSKWVKQLEGAQHADGSWGRFHSQDTRVKAAFRTSEEAIDRAFSLGLDGSHPVLIRAAHYIENVLNSRAVVTDRVEKSEAWPLLLRFILAGRLAALQCRWPQIASPNPVLAGAWECLVAVARQTFKSGKYNLADEAEAFVKVTKLHVPQGFIESQHALWILSSQPLPLDIDRQLVAWVWTKPDGIRYLRASLSDLQPRQIAYWLRSMNILTRFASWRQVSGELFTRLWDQRDELGLWDFGRQTAWCVDFPLSENWRGSLKRKLDYTTCVLALLRRYFD